MVRTPLTAGIALALSMVPAESHEFWIDPLAFQVGPGDEVVADLRVGQGYEGFASAYFPKDFRVFELAQGDLRRPVDGRLGDRPALQQAAPEGLQVVLHVTRDYRLTYEDFAKFEAFLREKDAAWVLGAHDRRGLPQTGVREVYSRYAKALIAVGDGAGQDRAYGFETEIVAGRNPYTEDLTGGMPVTLLYRGAPRADAQITVFEKDATGTVRVFTLRTGAAGRALVPVQPGRRYMLDAVVLREPSDALAESQNAVWESLWANLTFAVPEG